MSWLTDFRELADGLRGIPAEADISIRNTTVTVRTVAWTGGTNGLEVGVGTPTASDLLLVPNPQVREVDGDRRLEVKWITPAYAGPPSGGYTRDQLRPPEHNTGAPGVEFFYVIEGDNGAHPYALTAIDTNHALHYTLLLETLDRVLPF